MKYLREKSVKKLLKTMLYSKKPVYLAKATERRLNNDSDHHKQSDPNLTYRLAQLKNYIFQKHIYRIPLRLIADLGLVNFLFKTNLKIIITLERNLNRLFESNKKVTAVPDNPGAFINIYDRPFISYQEINSTKNADLYFTGILRSETALRQVFYLLHTNNFLKSLQMHTLLLAHLKAHKDNLIGMKFRLFMINRFNTQFRTCFEVNSNHEI